MRSMIRVRLLRDGYRVPATTANLTLPLMTGSDVHLSPGESVTLRLGLAVEVPMGVVALVVPESLLSDLAIEVRAPLVALVSGAPVRELSLAVRATREVTVPGDAAVAHLIFLYPAVPAIVPDPNLRLDGEAEPSLLDDADLHTLLGTSPTETGGDGYGGDVIDNDDDSHWLPGLRRRG